MMPKVTIVNAGGTRFGGPSLALIAGPCVIESERLCLRVAETLRTLTERLRMPFVFKASYDKANRSSARSFRGPGLNEGLRILSKVKTAVGVPVLTDVHSEDEVAAAAEVCDVLQIPAFLCRQTDLILAAAKSGRAVNVKKGQFMAPRDMKNAVEKVERAGCRRLLLTERGASFGYNNLVADMRSLPVMRAFGYPVIFDATHSVQSPGGAGDRSGGDAAMAPVLARAAVAAGCDGVFIETHPDPSSALSDGPNMIPLRAMRGVLEQLCAIRKALR
ncbi:MAG: 3-deoxy-8-phosphooctulonate synthase [Verrucomicrobia bacterium]|nr:3-deoxy-8-phosphooctulonate synthase [Verrucomicrobiota bacterium]